VRAVESRLRAHRLSLDPAARLRAVMFHRPRCHRHHRSPTQVPGRLARASSCGAARVGAIRTTH